MNNQIFRRVVGLVFYIFLLVIAFPIIGIAEETKPSLNLLVLSDIHFDPFTYCNKKRPCDLIQKLRVAPANAWQQILASQSARISSYNSDTNYPLLQSALSAAKDAAQANNVKAVLILGDFLAHDYDRNYRYYSGDKTKAGYQSFVKKTMEFLADQVGSAFSHIDVYPVVGNNDSYHRDYVVEPEGAFLRDMDVAWSRLIKNPIHKQEMQKTFKNAGYYAITLPETSLRLLIVDSVLFSSHFKSKTGAIYANQQLNWLHQQLQLARAQHQKVIIAMHIPMGIDVYATLRIKLFTLIQFWQTPYVKSFHNLLETYADTIAAILAGHLHADWFQVVTFKSRPQEIPAIGTPAVSPVFGNNPGFKIYNYSSDSGSLENFKTYYLPLNRGEAWKIEYDFHSSYSPHCRFCSMTEIFHSIRSNASLAAIYKSSYSVNTTSQPITYKWVPYYSCAMQTFFPNDYRTCIR